LNDYIDVTVPFRDKMMCFPGDPPCTITPHWQIKKGDIVNLSVLCMGSHTGTHIDAPNHFIDQGKTVEELPIEHFIGRAKVFEFLNKDYIDIQDIDNLGIVKNDIIIFKTDNSEYMKIGVFKEDFTYITPEAARFLAEKGILTLGFDFLSIEKFGSKDFGAHYALLGAGVVLIEGMDLTQISQGQYDMISLPMLIAGGNGSPIRVLLGRI
jgi:arylformamidase